MVTEYVPSRGDIVFLQFSPQQGREQAGIRPALVLSSKSYNAKVGLMLTCPITSRSKGYFFEVPLGKSLQTHGVVLADQVKSQDWRQRGAKFVERVPDGMVGQVLEKLAVLFE